MSTQSRSTTLPPVQITLPSHLISAFALLARAHNAYIEDCTDISTGSLTHVSVYTQPQLPLWVLAAWAEVYRHTLKTAPERGLRLVPAAKTQEAA